MDTMQSWFGLKDEYRDFSVRTEEDSALFFARGELDDQLQRRLRRAFRTENPIKLVLYGDWGVGKTHTMRHIQHIIETEEDYKARVTFIELPDITKKSTFQIAHSALLDALGLDAVREWVLKYHSANHNAKELIQDSTQSEDVATAFINLIAGGDLSRIAWDWLRGIKLSQAHASLAGLPTILEQSAMFVRALQMLGRFAREIDDVVLIFMIDETTKLDNISDSDAEAHWTNALKALADDATKEVGLVLSISEVDVDDMAFPLRDEQVRSRIGHDNYVLLRNLDVDDTRTFISDLFQQWVNLDRRAAILAEYEAETDGEAIDETTYPLTKDALALAAEYVVTESGEQITPRDIQKRLDDLLNRAIDDDRHILSRTYLETKVME